MGKAAESPHLSHSQSSSSTSSFSSQDFEFTVSLSPATWRSSSRLCSADELFFKGQLLPLQLIHSQIRPPPPPPPEAAMPPPSLPSPAADTNTCLSSPLVQPTATGACHPPPPPSHPMNVTVDSGGWSSDTASSRDSSSNSSSCDSSRRTSSATTDDNDSARTPATNTSLRKLRNLPLKKHASFPPKTVNPPPLPPKETTKSDPHPQMQISAERNIPPPSRSSKTKLLSSLFITKSKKMSKSAKQVFQKYINKMKPLYEKFSHGHPLATGATKSVVGEERGFVSARGSCSSNGSAGSSSSHHLHSHSFSGNLGFPKRKDLGPRHIGRSCPSSKRSSPSHSGMLVYAGEPSSSSSPSAAMDLSSMEELQSAIQCAIAHCKKSIAAQESRPNSLVTVARFVCKGGKQYGF